MTERTDGQVTWSDLGLWSGKMSPERSAATKGETLRQSSKRSSASQSRKPPILKCLKKDGQLGGATTMKWEDDGAWLGECMTRNTGESPNAAVVSRLSQILEVTPQEKYSLSAKACLGILRRAERRGKDLPERLKAVLLMQSASGGGCDGGGKGALVQTEKSGTLGTGNDQTIFTPTPINLMVATRREALGRGTGFGVGEPGDPANTISAAHSHAECGGNKPAVVALDMTHACDVIRECGEQAPSLQARMGTGGNQVPLTYPVQNMVVRRLTPMECERLQGFPDGWTDIGEWRDSKGKLRKPSDSPRYKALGNSIALPFWDFLAKRISAQYLRPVTMGSLFDGIGGFPLVFERHNGKGTARWASEIEEFPIAVTKLRFGED